MRKIFLSLVAICLVGSNVFAQERTALPVVNYDALNGGSPAPGATAVKQDTANTRLNNIKTATEATRRSVEIIDNTIFTDKQMIFMVDPADSSRRAEFDNLFKAPIGLTAPHHKIHDGDAYDSWINSEDLDDTATLALCWKTSNTTKWQHMTVFVNGTVEGNLELIESPIWSTSTGSQNTIFNKNRNSGNTSLLLEDTTGSFAANSALVLDPDNISSGTVIKRYHFGAGKKAGGEARGIAERILKQNTQYCLVTTSEADNNDVLMEVDWYEHLLQ